MFQLSEGFDEWGWGTRARDTLSMGNSETKIVYFIYKLALNRGGHVAPVVLPPPSTTSAGWTMWASLLYSFLPQSLRINASELNCPGNLTSLVKCNKCLFSSKQTTEWTSATTAKDYDRGGSVRLHWNAGQLVVEKQVAVAPLDHHIKWMQLVFC